MQLELNPGIKTHMSTNGASQEPLFLSSLVSYISAGIQRQNKQSIYNLEKDC